MPLVKLVLRDLKYQLSYFALSCSRAVPGELNRLRRQAVFFYCLIFSLDCVACPAVSLENCFLLLFATRKHNEKRVRFHSLESLWLHSTSLGGDEWRVPLCTRHKTLLPGNSHLVFNSESLVLLYFIKYNYRESNK